MLKNRDKAKRRISLYPKTEFEKPQYFEKSEKSIEMRDVTGKADNRLLRIKPALK